MSNPKYKKFEYLLAIIYAMENTNSLLFLSEKLLLNVKLSEDTSCIEHKLRSVSLIEFSHQLITDEAKKTFWINIYNAYFQVLSFRKKSYGRKLFSERIIQVAQAQFSLDDIEHGILRKYQWKWSLGYLSNPFVKLLVRNLAVQQIDFRIHFALNCGAKSCPPIAFYTVKKLDEQLDEAMYSFIVSETTIDQNDKIIKTSKLLYWYRGDFEGTNGIKSILSKIFDLDLSNYKILYNQYNWEMYLGNYV
ncbi:DUF547 domain-containing protein [Flavobacterium soyangense]|uniref:DUF547 domain-containing protein n=1 Tax=Flavobacterium soyangense TaxID=2023265 RepID=A0A930Y1K8_9FLAO|nr:DUF547 domain-containing protein [Flavobacterium soyangense]MBF2709594.1 DUF547 domain-containing protein [Flavobacterium soyangense]